MNTTEFPAVAISSTRRLRPTLSSSLDNYRKIDRQGSTEKEAAPHGVVQVGLTTLAVLISVKAIRFRGGERVTRYVSMFSLPVLRGESGQVIECDHHVLAPNLIHLGNGVKGFVLIMATANSNFLEVVSLLDAQYHGFHCDAFQDQFSVQV